MRRGPLPEGLEQAEHARVLAEPALRHASEQPRQVAGPRSPTLPTALFSLVYPKIDMCAGFAKVRQNLTRRFSQKSGSEALAIYILCAV